MGELKLDITASELTYEGFTKDLGEILSDKVMQRVADCIFEDMKETLAYRIEEDVYKQYTPDIYPRRSENPGFGTPLTDMDKNVLGGAKGSPGGAYIHFDYIPTGAHSGVFGDVISDERVLMRLGVQADDPIKPPEKQADGNALIRRIETGKGYDWKPNKKKAKKFTDERPFWQNFVNELIEGNGLAYAAKQAFKREGIEVSDISAEREQNDGNY